MFLSGIVLVALAAAGSPDYLAPLTEAQRVDGQKLIAEMSTNPRGPYAGISWFCNDGTKQLPKLNGCADHGGGEMYGVLDAGGRKLERFGVFVGTVLAALEPEQLLADSAYRARALVVERYLERALDGWVLRSAKSYRGFRHDEHEEKAARTLLIGLAADKPFLDRHRALIIRLSRALPYGRGAENLAAEIRAQAAVICDADKTFAPLRFKIHAAPEPTDVAAVDAYAEGRTDELGQKAKDLAAAMRAYYDPKQRLERLLAVKQWVSDKAVKSAIQTFADTSPTDTQALLVNGLAVMRAAEQALRPYTTVPERNLLLLHTIGLVEELWLSVTADIARRPSSRQQALADVSLLVEAAWHAGLLSPREHEATQESIREMPTGTAAYVQGVARLGRVLEWARARLVAEVGLALVRYQAVEPQAPAVIDDILRSGVMLPLAALLDRLVADGEQVKGSGHQLLGMKSATTSVRGENPGIALGTLRVIPRGCSTASLQRTDIALLQELPNDIPPVAGVITIGAVGSLSHVALLVRNLGIPLASVGGDVGQELAGLEGQRVLLGVSMRRRVVMGTFATLAADDQQLIRGEGKNDLNAGTLTIDEAALDLATRRVLPIEEVSEEDAGVRMGPKAAEVGRLHRLFPKRVSDAVVIPFGMFVQHVDTPEPDGSPSPLARVREAYAAYKVQVAIPGNEAKAEADVLTALATFRTAILERPFAPGFEAEVQRALKSMGAPGTFGAYVRSDTNVEDLKDFTGAGLNITVFNRVGPKSVLEAIREVWTSPFTERSFRWRQRLLTNPDQVFPSVLIHKTVPSEKSGVMLTTDLETGGQDALTISAGEGVSAVVEGAPSETLLLTANGGLRLLASPRAIARMVVPKPPEQGVRHVPTEGKDPLLTDEELAELRALAAEVVERAPRREGLPWDIEFGFVRGKAYLFQIRPVKLSRLAATHPYLVRLDAGVTPLTGPIDLAQALP